MDACNYEIEAVISIKYYYFYRSQFVIRNFLYALGKIDLGDGEGDAGEILTFLNIFLFKLQPRTLNRSGFLKLFLIASY
jgi:hypothetical protein